MRSHSNSYQRGRYGFSRCPRQLIDQVGEAYRDRGIREYCEDIWKVQPVPIEVEEYSQANGRIKVIN